MATFTRIGRSWQAKIRRRGHPVRSKTFTTKREAEDWAREVEAEMVRGMFVDRRQAERTMLGDLLERYRAEVTPTHRGYESETLRIGAMLRDPICTRIVATLTSSDFATYRNIRLKAVRPATVARELTIFSACLATAMRDWGISLPENPLANLKKPAPHVPRERRLSEQEERRLVAACADAVNPWILPLMQLALETGMRQGELLALVWENVNLDMRTAFLLKTKNGSARTVPLTRRATSILTMLPRTKDPRVFPTTASAVKQCWKRACKRAMVEDMHFHDLRHEALSRLASLNLNALELAAISGHKDLRVLHKYTHLRPVDLLKKLG